MWNKTTKMDVCDFFNGISVVNKLKTSMYGKLMNIITSYVSN